MTTPQLTPSQRMLAACERQPVDATPVWFMRQAGRIFPQYRELREKHEILTIARTPELAAKVTLLPVDELGVDAAVMFADIMLPLEGMGVPFYIEPEIGPIIPDPIRTKAAVDAIRIVGPEEGTPYVLEAVKLLRRELGERAALVGFSGSPFTLACYMIEGRPSRDYAHAKGLMFSQPAVWHDLMGRITDVIVLYLRGQVESGVQVVQLFDSWVGILSPDQYQRYVMPYARRIFQQLRKLGVPIHPFRHRGRLFAGTDGRRGLRHGERGLARAPRPRLVPHRLPPRHPRQPRPHYVAGPFRRRPGGCRRRAAPRRRSPRPCLQSRPWRPPPN